MTEPPVPSVLAILVCDQIIIDEQTKKKSLIGVFDNINSFAFPANVNCSLYAKLADAEGHYEFLVRIVNLKDERLLAEIKVPGDVNTRAMPAELAVYLMGVILPEPGKYELQLWANDVYLSRITMRAIQVTGGIGGLPWLQR